MGRVDVTDITLSSAVAQRRTMVAEADHQRSDAGVYAVCDDVIQVVVAT